MQLLKARSEQIDRVTCPTNNILESHYEALLLTKCISPYSYSSHSKSP